MNSRSLPLASARGLSFDLSDLHRTDLRQTVLLLALLQACSVTGAARQLGVTQPALSKALWRLRQEYADPLLVRDGNQMRRTPKAQAMLPLLEDALRRLSEAIATPGSFDPARIRRQVRLAANDYLQHVLAPPLIGRLRKEAPGVSLQFRPVGMWHVRQLLGEGLVDMVIGASADPGTFRCEPLFSDEFVCVAAPGSPPASLSLQAFCEREHVDVSPSGIGLIPSILDKATTVLSGERRVAATVSTFLALPATLAATGMVAVIPRGALRSCPPGSLAVCPVDFALPRYDVNLWWHNNTHADPLARWLRELLIGIARAHARQASRK